MGRGGGKAAEALMRVKGIVVKASTALEMMLEANQEVVLAAVTADSAAVSALTADLANSASV